MRRYTYILLSAVVLAALAGCSKKKFVVEGAITDAEGETLYLENMGLDGPVKTDSVVLDAAGAFSFSGEAVTRDDDGNPGAPEFYRLRIKGRIVNICVDSTETIRVEASYPTMPVGYTVTGSEDCLVIKELVLKQIALQESMLSLQRNIFLAAEVREDSIESLLSAYKADIRANYIYKAPMKAYSYFALFQAVGRQLIFNPRDDRDDIKAFAAVATSWDVHYPGSLRGKNLHNIALESMKNMRIADNNAARREQLLNESYATDVTSLIDVPLTDNRGHRRSLTELTGQVVMLDFHVFATEQSTARILKLRELYNKYHAQGFDIYQVSLDSDEHFWKQQTAALPWVSVRDQQGAASSYLQSYNIQSIPTFFLIDRSNALYKRDSQIDDIDAEIQSLLK